MKVLVFDVETTGLPTERDASIFNSSKFPYIVQLSYILYDTDTHAILTSIDQIIKLDESVDISPESINIHKITKSISREKGVDIKYALNIFNKTLTHSDKIIGHNISFDKRMLMVEGYRNNIKTLFTVNNMSKPEYCTMRHGVDICKIERTGASGKKYFKFPTLSELHNHLFGSMPNGVHNSFVDILICLRCYCNMEYNRDIYDEIEFNELYNKYSI
jgi:DNA polymerase III epsilon subunit-like protein